MAEMNAKYAEDSMPRKLEGEQPIADVNHASSSLAPPVVDGGRARAMSRIEFIRKNFAEHEKGNGESFISDQRSSHDSDDQDVVDVVEDGPYHWTHQYLPIHPESKLRKWISVFVMAAAVWNLFAIPFRICFSIHYYLPIYFIEYFLDLCLMMQICINLVTAFVHEGFYIRSFVLIRERYKINGLYWHVFATFPFELLCIYFGESYIPFFRIPRLLWLRFVDNQIKEMEKDYLVSPSFLRISKVMFVIFWFIHTYGCTWYLISVVATKSESTWIEVYGLDDGTTFAKYVASCYWVVTVMTTVGFGDIIPTRTEERLFAMFTMLTGAVIYALIMGTMTSIVQALDKSASRYREKLDTLEEYIAYRKIPAQLKKKVLNYYQVLWSRSKGLDENSILEDLPTSLRAAIALHLNRPLLRKCPLFKDCTTPGFINSVVVHLHPVVALPGEYVIRHGEIGREMFFVRKGELRVLAADGKTVLKVIGDGSFFGDIALLLESRRTASVKATTCCDLLLLKKKDFDSVLEFFPDYAEVMRNRAKFELQRKMPGIPRSRSDVGMSVSKQSLETFSIPKGGSRREVVSRRPSDNLQTVPIALGPDVQTPPIINDPDAVMAMSMRSTVANEIHRSGNRDESTEDEAPVHPDEEDYTELGIFEDEPNDPEDEDELLRSISNNTRLEKEWMHAVRGERTEAGKSGKQFFPSRGQATSSFLSRFNQSVSKMIRPRRGSRDDNLPSQGSSAANSRGKDPAISNGAFPTEAPGRKRRRSLFGGSAPADVKVDPQKSAASRPVSNQSSRSERKIAHHEMSPRHSIQIPRGPNVVIIEASPASSMSRSVEIRHGHHQNQLGKQDMDLPNSRGPDIRIVQDPDQVVDIAVESSDGKIDKPGLSPNASSQPFS